MISTRYRIIVLVISNIGIIMIPSSVYYLNILLLVLFNFVFRHELSLMFKTVILYLFFLFFFSIVLNFIFSDTSLSHLLISSLKIFTIINISILLAYDLNIMELVSFFRKIKIPATVSIAIGVGFRYMGLLVEDLKRINFVQTMNGFGINRASVINNGLFKTINVFSLPLFLTLLKRTENISISISIQDIVRRSEFYQFQKTTILEIFLLVISLLALLFGLFFQIFS